MARIPDAMKSKFQRMIEESKGDARFKKILATGSDENFKWAYEFAYERAYGKAPQSVDMNVNDTTPRPTAEELDLALRSLRDSQNGNGVEKSQ